MSGSIDDPTLVDLTADEARVALPEAPAEPGAAPPQKQGHRRRFRLNRRSVVRALPAVARVFRALGVLVLSFVVFVVVFGSMRHTVRQDHLEAAFRTRVAGGHAARPTWQPVPGQAIATISIPTIGLYEVVVEDSTVELLKGGPGHVLGTPLPGRPGNAVVIGRRATDGAPFGDLGDLSPGDPITVVTPYGPFTYRVSDVTREPASSSGAFASSQDAHLTLVTSASAFVPGERLVVTAQLDGTSAQAGPIPRVQQQSSDLGTAGDPDAIVPLLPWLAALIAAIGVWLAVVRRRIPPRWTRFIVATPVLVVLLYFVFENAETLLPGSI